MIPNPNGLEDAIANAVKAMIDDEVKVAIKRAHDDLDRRIPEIVAGVAIRVLGRVRMETGGAGALYLGANE